MPDQITDFFKSLRESEFHAICDHQKTGKITRNEAINELNELKAKIVETDEYRNGLNDEFMRLANELIGRIDAVIASFAS